jgi:hypothetical protein
MLVQVSTAHPCYLLNSEVYESVDTGNGFQFYESGQLFGIRPNHPILLQVWRAKESLPLRLQHDSIKTMVRVNSKLSWVYWLNFTSLPIYGVAFLGDIGSQKKFVYPNDIFVDLEHLEPAPTPAPEEHYDRDRPKVIFSKDAK